MCCDACVVYRREQIAAKVRAIDRRAVHQQYAVDAGATVFWIGRRDDCEGGRQSFQQSAQFRADVAAQRRIHLFQDSACRALAQFGGEVAHAGVRFVGTRRARIHVDDANLPIFVVEGADGVEPHGRAQSRLGELDARVTRAGQVVGDHERVQVHVDAASVASRGAGLSPTRVAYQAVMMGVRMAVTMTHADT